MLRTRVRVPILGRRAPLCLTGGSGTGKSHLLIALRTGAAIAGYRVRCTLATKLVNELVEAADEEMLTKTIARYGRADLLASDELGYMKLDRRGAELLFRVLSEREEKNSVAIASNESVGGNPSPACGFARPSWTGSPSAATSSRPAPTPTASPAPGPPALKVPPRADHFLPDLAGASWPCCARSAAGGSSSSAVRALRVGETASASAWTTAPDSPIHRAKR